MPVLLNKMFNWKTCCFLIVIFNKFMMFNNFERLATKFMISTPLFWKLIQYCDLWLSFPVNCLKIAHLWSRCWALGIQFFQEYVFYDSVSAESYISLTLGQIMKSFQWKIIYIQKKYLCFCWKYLNISLSQVRHICQ